MSLKYGQITEDQIFGELKILQHHIEYDILFIFHQKIIFALFKKLAANSQMISSILVRPTRTYSQIINRFFFNVSNFALEWDQM